MIPRIGERGAGFGGGGGLSRRAGGSFVLAASRVYIRQVTSTRHPSGAVLLACVTLLSVSLAGCASRRERAVTRPGSPGAADSSEEETGSRSGADAGPTGSDSAPGRRGRQKPDETGTAGTGPSDEQRIRGASPGSSEDTAGEALACSRLTGTHVIRRGETLWRISRQYGVPLEVMAGCNGVEDVRSIIAGETLRVPGPALGTSDRGVENGLSSGQGSGAEPLIDPTGEFVAVDEELPQVLRDRLKWPSGDGPSQGEPVPVFEWPVPGVVTSPFGRRRGRLHAGLDLRAGMGTQVHAARDGTVIYSGNGHGGYGNLIIIDHGDGWFTLYAHNSRNLVRESEVVSAGETIALVGRTGNATAPHLHFEIRRGELPVNPIDLLPAGMLASKGR